MMRMSCNGCRVLRKGCTQDCALKPCLEWIKSPDSQANATLFLAKFYGRAGLINLINSGPHHLRPEIFRSLLYEACGRIINPIYGSVGLMSSGNWQRCLAAVEAVLRGSSLVTTPFSADNGRDIRHVSRESFSSSLNCVRGLRNRFKRSGAKTRDDSVASESNATFTITGWDQYCHDDNYKEFGMGLSRAPSQDSASAETVEPALMNRIEEPIRRVKPETNVSEIGLELTLA